MDFTDLLDAYLEAKRDLAEVDLSLGMRRRYEFDYEEAKARLNDFVSSGGLRP